MFGPRLLYTRTLVFGHMLINFLSEPADASTACTNNNNNINTTIIAPPRVINVRQRAILSIVDIMIRRYGLASMIDRVLYLYMCDVGVCVCVRKFEVL